MFKRFFEWLGWSKLKAKRVPDPEHVALRERRQLVEDENASLARARRNAEKINNSPAPMLTRDDITRLAGATVRVVPLTHKCSKCGYEETIE